MSIGCHLGFDDHFFPFCSFAFDKGCIKRRSAANHFCRCIANALVHVRRGQHRLYYDERGLDKYYGLLELGELGGMWKNVAGRYEMDGKKIYAKQILANPKEYFTEEVMQKLDVIAKGEFSYG